MGWGVDDIPDLEGRIAIVTGANSGIGLAVTRELATRDATVIMACRRFDRGEAARSYLAETIDRARLDVRECDLADLSSIHAFAAAIEEDYDELHLLCNNAGVMAIPRRETADGFERQFGVNHLGHFALTGLLIDRLAASPGRARVVTQGSLAHREVDGLDLDDVVDPERYDRRRAYARSKLANALFARELDRRLRASELTLQSLCCEPGFVRTNLHVRGPAMEGKRWKVILWRLAQRLFGQSPTAGALPMLYAAVSDDLEGGAYVRPSGLMGLRGAPTEATPSEAARDGELARALWSRSVEWTDVDLGLASACA